MLKGLLHFLFGKSPDIFDNEGRVRHRLPEDKWKKWEERYLAGEEYNWRNHTGMKKQAHGESTSNQSHSK